MQQLLRAITIISKPITDDLIYFYKFIFLGLSKRVYLVPGNFPKPDKNHPKQSGHERRAWKVNPMIMNSERDLVALYHDSLMMAACGHALYASI